MPRGKNKKVAKANKKKPRSSKPSAPRPSSQNTNDSQSDDNNQISSRITSFAKSKNSNSTLHQGMYQTYKMKTQSFRDRLKKILPKSTKLTSVSDLNRASNLIFEKALDQVIASTDGKSSNRTNEHSSETMIIDIPDEIIKDLDQSIKLRSKVGKKFSSDFDDGHAYMLRTLVYCRTKLKQARSILKIVKKSTEDSVSSMTETQHTHEKKPNSNRFEFLADSDDEDDDEDEESVETIITEDMVKKRTIPIVTPPEEPEEEYSIEEDLIKGSDRFQACAFLESIEQHMHLVETHYKLLKTVMQAHSGSDYYKDMNSEEDKDLHTHQTSSHLQLLLECAAVTNMAIESVQSMEAALAVDRPHLSTFYNLIAVIFFPEPIAHIVKMMKTRGEQSTIRAKNFVGGIIESIFHYNKNDPLDAIVRRFVRDEKLKYGDVYPFAKAIKLTMFIEAPLACEEHANSELISIHTTAQKSESHSYLRYHPSIGKDKNILNTQKLVQQVFDVLNYRNKLISRGGFFGDMWAEDKHPARKIRGDMDQLLGADILPELIAWCIGEHSPITQLPHTQELLTLMQLIRTHVKKLFDPNKNNCRLPVPISLTFGFHAILTSIITLQGNGDIKRLATCAKMSYHALFDQLEDVSKSDLAKQVPVFGSNILMFKQLKYLAKPIGQRTSDTSEEHAFWNPVVGGQLALLAIYTSNIGLGSASIDCIGQLRFTLHLYNALKENKLIGDNEGPLLKLLDKVFHKTRAIWVGSRPLKGEFEKKFLISWGYALSEASRRSKNKSLSLSPDSQNSIRFPATRDLEPIEPKEYSESYKRLIERDFSEDVDDYTIMNFTDDQKKTHKSIFDLMSRVNMMRDSMDEDEDDVIPVNFSKVALILHEFVLGLSRTMGWEDIVEKQMISYRATDEVSSMGNDFTNSDINLRYQGYAMFIEQFLKHLDSLNDDESKETNPIRPLLDHNKAAEFMSVFFKNVPKTSYRYFWEETENASNTSVAEYTISKALDEHDFASVMELKSTGNALFGKGKLDEAILSYREALDHYGSSRGSPGEQRETLVSILSNIALIHFQQRQFVFSEEYATKALEIDPNHGKCLFRRAAACYEISLISEHGDIARLTKAKYDLMKCKFAHAINKQEQNELVGKVLTALEEYNANDTAENNPLLGSYPSGRTGRTKRDPLPAFLHFKYSKSGEMVTRLIKPGKSTPYVMRASREERRKPDFKVSNHIETPYEEQGSKVERLKNGKFRHIASYSMRELVELGWDGAKYVSTKSDSDAHGKWCPFVCGYDSDSGDEYESFDISRGKRLGTVGLMDEEVGLYMDVPLQGIRQLTANNKLK